MKLSEVLFLINSLKDPQETAAHLPELLPLGLGHAASALGNDRDRQWVKDFAASNKSQAVYEFAQWLDRQGLKLQISSKGN